MAAARAQHLLGRPQGVAPARGAHHGEVHQVDPRGGQRRGIGQVRRREPGDAPAPRGQGGERRQDELQLADALALAQELGEPARGPSAPRQLPVEGGKAARHRGGFAEAGRAAPRGVVPQEIFQSRHILYLYTV